MTKLDRLNEAFRYLIGRGIISSQKDVAKALSANKTSISLAFNGHNKYLSDSFLMRFCNAYKEISIDWLLSEKGGMLSVSESNTTNSTLPGVKCTNPDCLNKIEQLTKDLNTANEDKSLLKEHIALLKAQIEQLKAGKGALPPEKRDSGSVEKPGENKKAS